ncbi:MAG: maleylpyruvate isomerase N-terminal domain-containing protein, partial [Bacteroidota bacterium]
VIEPLHHFSIPVNQAMTLVPIEVLPLFRPLNGQLISLLKSLGDAEWQAQTIAKLWKVKDVAGHLLDGNIRLLSMLRDNYYGESFDGGSYAELVGYLNQLNADWVKAMRRVSPAMLIALHEATHESYVQYYESLNPLGPSRFSVAWAGENESQNWMHIAREYTEKFLHQQQIRDAAGKPALMNTTYFQPFAEVCMLALPYTFREVDAQPGTALQVQIPESFGGSWTLIKREEGWNLSREEAGSYMSKVVIPADVFWKMVSKSIRPEEVQDQLRVEGDQALGEVALNMVSFMA